MNNHQTPAPDLAALRVMTLTSDGERARKLAAALADAGVARQEGATSLAQAMPRLTAGDFDIVVADLHPDAHDALMLPDALKAARAYDHRRASPRVLWSGEYSPAAPWKHRGSWLARHARISDSREVARIGGMSVRALESHARLARRQGIHVEIIRSAGPLGLQGALKALVKAEPIDLPLPPPSTTTPTDEEIIEALMSGNGLGLAIQPQYDLPSRKIIGAEALIRWRHPRLGELAPACFLPGIQRLGLELLLFSFVRSRVLDVLRELSLRGAEIPIAINAGLTTVCTPGLPQRLEDAMRQAGLPTRLLKIELTEEALVQDPLMLATALNALRARGFCLSLDDLGAGSATLAMLANQPFDEIKLDGSLIRGLHDHSSSRAVIAALIELARLMNVTLVAEGIETDADATTLRRLGCRIGQGYALSRPLSVAAFLQRLPGVAPP